MIYFWRLVFSVYLLTFFLWAALIVGGVITNDSPFKSAYEFLFILWELATSASIISSLYRLSFRLKFIRKLLWLLLLINGFVNRLMVLFSENIIDFSLLLKSDLDFSVIIYALFAIGLQILGVVSLYVGFLRSRLVKTD